MYHLFRDQCPNSFQLLNDLPCPRFLADSSAINFNSLLKIFISQLFLFSKIPFLLFLILGFRLESLLFQKCLVLYTTLSQNIYPNLLFIASLKFLIFSYSYFKQESCLFYKLIAKFSTFIVVNIQLSFHILDDLLCFHFPSNLTTLLLLYISLPVSSLETFLLG